MVATLDIRGSERVVIECLFWKEKVLLTFKRFLAPWPDTFRLLVLEQLQSEAVGGQLLSNYVYDKAKNTSKILLRGRHIVSHLKGE